MRVLIIFFCFMTPCIGISQLTIHLMDSTGHTTEEESVFLAGNFQGWQPGMENWKLDRKGNNSFVIKFYPSPGDLEFKFTKGDWSTVEADMKGSSIENRKHYYNGRADTIWLQISGWADSTETISTATDNVKVWQENYTMNTLSRVRKIWVYLPPDYHTTDKTYPVMYMHDGQNVFDEVTSYAGEWKVDETLNELFEQGDHGCIVVAIDNGEAERMNEYSPWQNEQYGGGLGKEYVDFIVQQLKPDIDRTFRTKTQRDHTGIMGSSMGGLISLYAGLEHPDVFGRIGSFSPAYWFSRETLLHASRTIPELQVKIYTIAGELEGNQYLQNIEKMEQTLLDAGYPDSDMKLIFHEDGEHKEWYWAREFRNAYLWLFSDHR